MTLSPVFRSPDSVRLLAQEGVWERLAPAVEAQTRAVAAVRGDLPSLLDARFLAGHGESGTPPEDSPTFLQEFFFLILFRSLFQELGVSHERLQLYSELDFCIKGTITAADNLFDDQGKSLLPLKVEAGDRFLSILQLMCFERLARRVLDRGLKAGSLSRGQDDEILRGLISLMADIGTLEGSEEGGVEEIPTPDEMVDGVHRVRGGALFALAFVAPAVLETGVVAKAIQAAEPAVARLGTAFQIVDDLTDFEFDVGRRSHNLLVSQIHHRGAPAEQEALDRLQRGDAPASGMVEDVFRESARAVLERAYSEARASFRELEKLGFWFPPHLADEVVHAIVGLEGVTRMATLAGEG
ncbi:MAG: class 1 isoprenoid biosynthesis enzyme [Gemmatimonadota bacterium]